MNFYLVAFLILPVLALAAKESGKLKMSSWLIFFTWLAAGWLLINLAVQSYLANLDALVRSTRRPSQELLDELQGDGAKQVFALYFGWAYAGVYFLTCLLVVKAVGALRRRLSGH